MNIIELQERTPENIARLLDIWEASVRATHTFLKEDDIARIRGYVPQALGGVAHLAIAEDDSGAWLGFLGTEGNRLEMLFLAPEARGKGIGKQLISYAVENLGVRELTVNEQNPQAIGFYRHLGFETYRRTERDEAGDPYPLLYMRLK